MDRNDGKINNALSPSELHLNMALEAGQMGTWQVDLHTLELSGSHTLLDIHGLTELPQNLSQAINEIVHPDDRAEVNRLMFSSVENHTPFVHQYRIVRPDGAVRWLEGRGKTHYDSEGKPTILVGIVMDITDEVIMRKKAEEVAEAFAIEGHKLETIFQKSTVAMAIWRGKEMIFEKTNPLFQAIFGGRQLVGLPLLEAIPEVRDQKFAGLLDDVFKTGEPCYGKEEFAKLLHAEDGQMHDHYFDYSYIRINDEHGEPYGVIDVAVDVTDKVLARKKIEEVAQSLAIERHKLEAIFQDSPVAMALWRGRDMVFEKANPEFQSWFEGRKLEGRTLLDAIPELGSQQFPELLNKVFETGESVSGREVFAQLVRKKDGLLEDGYYDFKYVRINDVNGNPYGVYDLAIDVTDRVLARHALEESKSQLEHMVKSLEQEREIRERFVATLSHDLRNPLSTARMCTELLSRPREDSESFEKTIGRIMHSVDEMDEMIRNLLDANRITAGERIPLKIGEGEIHEIIRATLEELSLLYGNRFIFKENTEPIVGYWDSSAIKRVIENLCSNAVKYGDPSEITISVNLLSDGVEIDISVQNWGTPIPKEDLDTLFEYFKRRKIAQIEGHVGWGIGLTIVRGLAEAHGGSALVESTEEAGTIFKVILPRDARSKVSTTEN